MVMLHNKAFAGHGALFSFDVAAVGPYPLFCFIVFRLKAFWSQRLWGFGVVDVVRLVQLVIEHFSKVRVL